MIIGKSKPMRDKEFMRFCHERMGGSCCICLEQPFYHLHHFGDDGGMGLKPNDYEVARVCAQCHLKHGLKKRALLVSVEPEKLETLLSFMGDALKLNRAWIEHLKNGLPVAVAGCALEDLNQFLLRHADLGLIDKRDWFIRWADRRAADLFDHLISDKE